MRRGAAGLMEDGQFVAGEFWLSFRWVAYAVLGGLAIGFCVAHVVIGLRILSQGVPKERRGESSARPDTVERITSDCR
jgi:hypothetical protein